MGTKGKVLENVIKTESQKISWHSILQKVAEEEKVGEISVYTKLCQEIQGQKQVPSHSHLVTQVICKYQYLSHYIINQFTKL
jgi:hypothetical protein